MEAKREQVYVGIFVLIAAALLIVTVFWLTGALHSSSRIYYAKFHNVAGLEPGATVRYEGGSKVGRVEKVLVDPSDPSLMDLEFSVGRDIPVKTDSKVAIMSFSPLGDNHLEIRAGSPGAQPAPVGAILPSVPYVGFNDLTVELNEMAPQAKQLLANLNDRVTQLRTTLDRVNDLVNDRNRENVSASLAELHGILAENRPQIKNTLKNVNAASEKIGPLLDQIHKTIEQADATIKKVDSMIGENKADIHASVLKLRESLDHISVVSAQLQRLLEDNSYNIDEILFNLRMASDNLRVFTDEISSRPSSLIIPNNTKDRKPGEKQ